MDSVANVGGSCCGITGYGSTVCKGSCVASHGGGDGNWSMSDGSNGGGIASHGGGVVSHGGGDGYGSMSNSNRSGITSHGGGDGYGSMGYSNRGGVTSHGSGDGYGSSVGNSYRCSDLSDGGGKRSLVYDGVESVDGISGVFDSADSTVGFNKAVASLDNITITALLLALSVTGESVLDVVSVAVLGMRVEVGVDGDLGDGGGGNSNGCSNSGYGGGVCPGSDGGSGSHDSGGSQIAGIGYGDEGGEYVELQEKSLLESNGTPGL